jgi:two-component system, OmpR family, sensor histidine kinase SenX3
VEWVTVLAASLALVVCVFSWRQHARLREAEARVEAVRAVLPDELSTGPVDGAVRRLAATAEACAERLTIVESAVDAAPMGLLVLDRSLAVAYASGDARAIVYGGETGQATMARVRSAAAAVLSTGQAREERVELFGPRRRVLRLTVAPVTERVPDQANAATHVGGVTVELVDVTERERVEAMRRDFVSNVSHELKTPLGALSVLAEVLADADDAVTRKRLAGRVQDEAGRMSDLVRDLLDLSRVESEEPDASAVGVDWVVDEAVRRAAVLADASGVAVRVEVPAESLVMVADRAQLVTAVANLLDNAVAHSIPGGGGAEVVVRAARSGDDVVIEVEDHGVGIPPDEQDRIFERFYRVDRGRARERGGTGLGLAIVRHVALSHGGTVGVESVPGAGATFALRIPTGV